MNKYQKKLIDFMKTGKIEMEIELNLLSQRELIILVKEQQQRINTAIEYINYMFDKANENDIIDDLLKIEKILKESEE